jgi:hypothetical protein
MKLKLSDQKSGLPVALGLLWLAAPLTVLATD